MLALLRELRFSKEPELPRVSNMNNPTARNKCWKDGEISYVGVHGAEA